MNRRDIALTALRCMDLTSLTDDEKPHEIQELVERGATIHGPVAAICLFAKHLDQPYFSVPDERIQVATVVNFPLSQSDADAVAEETRRAIDAGADEIDLVLPYHNLDAAPAIVNACRTACDGKLLKVILETGELGDSAKIKHACRIALDGGADFLKTSTGKSPISATLDATAIMLQSIVDAGRLVGLKPSGGIRTLAQAEPFITQARAVLGPLSADNFRLGASSLLTDVLVALRKNEGA